MPGKAHLSGLVRWPGMPTSGRFVYQSRLRGGWYWQCDLHDDNPSLPDQWGEGFKTMRAAFDAAMEHAEVCDADTK